MSKENTFHKSQFSLQKTLIHFGYKKGPVIMTSPVLQDRKVHYYERLDCVWDAKKKSAVTAHQLVKNILKCNNPSAWAYMKQHNLL